MFGHILHYLLGLQRFKSFCVLMNVYVWGFKRGVADCCVLAGIVIIMLDCVGGGGAPKPKPGVLENEFVYQADGDAGTNRFNYS